MRHIIAIAGLIIGIGTLESAAPAHAEVPAALPQEVGSLFSIKCGQCHSERLVKPKGHLGYITDLRRVASNPKLVLPFDAERSKLWQEIEDEEMPPDNAKAGSLTDAEKGLIRWWIDAGAPSPQSSAAAAMPTTPAARRPLPTGERLLRWVGRFHVLVVHFPIALLLAGALAEAWLMMGGSSQLSPVVKYCVLLGATGAAAAAGLGWARAPFVGHSGAGQTLMLHRWVGTAAGAMAVVAAIAVLGNSPGSRSSAAFRVALFASALLVGFSGHLGGTLVYGDGYFAW